jgi:hypothetical protein
MATISFQVIGIGDCTMQLDRAYAKLSDPNTNPIEHDVTDGFFSNSVPPLPPLPIEPSKVLIYVDPRRVRNESLAVNETFTVDMKIDSLTNHSGIISYDFYLSWDPTLLKCINVTEVMFHEVVPESEWLNNTIGCDRYVWNDDGEMRLHAFLLPKPHIGNHHLRS